MHHFGPRHFLATLGSAMFLVAATGATAQPRASGEELARMVLEAWNSQDLNIVDEVFADDGFYEDLFAGTKREGREAIKAGFAETHDAVPDFKAELTRIFSSGSMIACEWVMSGTQAGDYPGLPATGKSFSVRGASIAQVRGGKIVRWTDYYDGFAFLQQLGVVSLPSSEQHQ